jgi:peptide/nickel transport system substrate-binding protein
LDITRIASWKERDLKPYTDAKSSFAEIEQSMVYYIVFNTTDKNFSDVRIREAVMTALDRDALIKLDLNGHGVKADTLMQPNNPLYPKDVAPYAFDTKRSYDLLQQAGWVDTNGDGIVEKNGQPLKVSLKFDNVDDQLLAEAVQQQLKKGGFDVELVGSDFNTVLSALRSTTIPFELAFMGASYRPFPGAGGTHYWMARYNDARAVALLDAANSSGTDAEAKANFSTWGKYIHDQVPIGVIYFKSVGYAVNPNLVGYKPHSIEWFPNPETWYFK